MPSENGVPDVVELDMLLDIGPRNVVAPGCTPTYCTGPMYGREFTFVTEDGDPIGPYAGRINGRRSSGEGSAFAQFLAEDVPDGGSLRWTFDDFGKEARVSLEVDVPAVPRH